MYQRLKIAHPLIGKHAAQHFGNQTGVFGVPKLPAGDPTVPTTIEYLTNLDKFFAQ